MRLRAGVVVVALVVASCGSSEGEGDAATTASPATTTAPPAGAMPTPSLPDAAAGTIAHLWSDDIATAATFLAVDAGYDLEQIVVAGPAGRLSVNGQIVDADDEPEAPTRPPTALLLDDVTAEYEVAGLRSAPMVPLSGVMVRFQEAVEPPGREIVYQRLFVLMALLQQGYTLEQIMDALFTAGGLNAELALTDQNGVVVVPADEPYESLALTDEDYDRALPPPTTTTTEPRSEEEQRLDELVDRAVGIYPITEDLGVHLRGLGDVISVVPPVGEFVVAQDGTISGSFVYTIVQGVDDARLTSTWDRTLVEAPLTLLDDGLTFTAPVDLLITWNESDTQPYGENLTGILDVDLGQLVLTGFTELDSVRFAR